MAETPLARAARAMAARPEDDARRVAFLEALAGAGLVLPLLAAEGDDVTPETEGGLLVAHDRPEGLAGREVAQLSGLQLARMLRGQGAGLLLRLGGVAEPVAVTAEQLDWLADTLAHGPARLAERPVAAFPPAGLPPALLGALDRRLAQGEGLADAALLALVDWADGSRGHLLALVGARPGAEEPIAAGLHAAVALSGAEGVRLDVAFLRADDPALARLARVALRFDLRAAPGEVPDGPPGGPPRLR